MSAPMLRVAQTLAVSMAVAPDVVYAYVRDPHHLSRWAKGFATTVAEQDGEWMAQTPMGEVVIRFAADNAWGGFGSSGDPALG